MRRWILLASAVLVCVGCGEDPTQVRVTGTLADRLNKDVVHPEHSDDWHQNCDVDRFGGIKPLHACAWPRDGYAPKCTWYMGRRTDDGRWAPLDADVDGTLDAVCVCQPSQKRVDKVCGSQ